MWLAQPWTDDWASQPEACLHSPLFPPGQQVVPKCQLFVSRPAGAEVFCNSISQVINATCVTRTTIKSFWFRKGQVECFRNFI